ncbi:hypothetical protein BST99_08590 [Aureicoccus marinus]|uniref:SecDF P1 head subdomain domain-containing protein n=1 Tax=Aureicoccus marinus TaxID=754435 RepID=A0A2S7T778_9FLAO|nr:hypothetical protein BST99_08590 [Aureicoccus marinus]
MTENESEVTSISEVTQNGQLRTGWYFLSDKDNGIEKTLNGTKEIYYLNPSPIVTADNFTELEIYQSNYGDYGMTIRLDKKGTKQWSIATGKSIGKKLALVIDNELYFLPQVNAQIDVGITALNRGDLSETELKAIKNIIEKEKK